MSKSAVLVVCGTICLLASLGAIAYLYESHADKFILSNGTGNVDTGIFAMFAGLPSLAVFIAGAKLAAIGVEIGRGDSK